VSCCAARKPSRLGSHAFDPLNPLKPMVPGGSRGPRPLLRSLSRRITGPTLTRLTPSSSFGRSRRRQVVREEPRAAESLVALVHGADLATALRRDLTVAARFRSVRAGGSHKGALACVRYTMRRR
jgi:hypothetical protein